MKNNDVLIEILSRLPVQSLFRFRAVCKFWGDAIDSPSFIKLHTDNHNSNKSDNALSLHVSLSTDDDDGNREQKKQLSIKKMKHDDKSLMSYESNRFNGSWLSNWTRACGAFRLVGAVKGLICMNNNTKFEVPLAICNPFLGQLKILPLSTSSFSNSSCRVYLREVAIGFDEDDYKVVQLLVCNEHLGFHAQLYSRRTNSWRELAGVLDDLDICWVSPIASLCKNGYFGHWLVDLRDSWKKIILSFDMKNEEFRTITFDYNHKDFFQILAEDEHSFINIAFFASYGPLEEIKLAGIYESRCEGSELSWNHVTDVEIPFSEMLRSDGYVFSEGDYRVRELMRRFMQHWRSSEFVECRGSFVSP